MSHACEIAGVKRFPAHRCDFTGQQYYITDTSSHTSYRMHVPRDPRYFRMEKEMSLTCFWPTSTGPARHCCMPPAHGHMHIRSQRTRFTQDGDKAFEFTTQPRTLGRAAPRAAGRTVRPCGRGQTRATQTKTGTTGRTPHTILTPHLRRQKFSRSSRGKPLRAPRLRARGRVQ